MSTTVSGLDALNNAATKGTDSSSSKTKLFDDMQTFLYLLTQQLQYQDPLEPMDTSEYTQQLVQYAGVEQQIQTNNYLESLISQNINAMSAQSVSYIDKTVQALSSSLPLQDGSAKFAYTLDTDAVSCVITVKDADGNYVKSFTDVDHASGRHELTWDGKDDSGNQLPDGAYTVVVAALDASGSSVSAQTTVFGRVTAVAYDGQDVAVAMGDAVVDMNSILAIHSSQPTTATQQTNGETQNAA